MILVLAITSPTAFLEIDGIPSALLALQNLRTINISPPITVASNSDHAAEVRHLLKDELPDIRLLDCDPTKAKSLAQALAPMCVGIDAVMIHDASRPLAGQTQMEDVLGAFSDDVDAVRPAVAFTETLKILNANSVIKKTLDRSTVLRISTPELIRNSAIDFAGSDCGWFLPLKKGTRTLHIEGSPNGWRINTSEDRDLVELIRD